MKGLANIRLSLVFLALAVWAHLKWFFFLPMCAISLGYIYVYGKENRRLKEELERLEKGCFYQEQLIHGFRKNRKILGALEEVEELCDGMLWRAVERSRRYIQEQWLAENCFEQAFAFIEQDYGSDLMRRLHLFLIHAETWGGETDGALELFLVNLHHYKSRSYEMVLHRKEQLKKLNLTLALSAAICLAITRLLPEQLQNRDSLFYQITMGGSLILFQGIAYFFLFHILSTRNMFSCRESRNYDKLWTGLLKRNSGFVHERARQILEKEISYYYPEWLMDLLLRLQTESVANAIEGSLQTAPEVLQYPLMLMIQEMKQDPLTKAPYVHFLKDVELPEIRTLMLQLYGIRNLGKDAIQKQILLMLDQGRQMEESANELALKDWLSLNGLLAAVPMLVTVMMMLLYMSYSLLRFLRIMAEGGVL